MAINQSIDITQDINADGRATLDIGGYDYAVVQFVSPTTTVSFLSTSDAGDIHGVSDGSAASATNFVATQGIDLADSTAKSSIAASSQIRFSGVGRFLRLIGPGLTVTKAIVRLYKIN